ncbi:MAG: LysR family transcriptional regulator [Alphaproteobacteria bacterium]|nr:MAG: LysR family transcriptional regulator [Alphaproteobacteria bacterium]
MPERYVPKWIRRLQPLRGLNGSLPVTSPWRSQRPLSKVPLSQRQLRYFVAVVEAGSFSRAARSLSVAQSALSHQISELEQVLGVPLLDRHARGVVTTVPGERLYRHAKAIGAAISNAEFDVRTFGQQPSGRITLGMSHPVVDPLTVPFLTAMREQLPNVQISLFEAISSTAAERLLNGQTDFALVYNPSEDRRLEFLPLLEEDLYLVGTREMIGPTSEPVHLSTFDSAPVLPPYPPLPQRALKKRVLLRDLVRASEWLTIDSHSAMRRMAMAGLGCTIVPRSSVASDLRDGTLHARPITNPSVAWTLNLGWLSDRPQTRVFLAVKDLLLSVILAEVQQGRWEGRALLTGAGS